jgi:hypothetical protein
VARADYPERIAAAHKLRRVVQELPEFHAFTRQWLRSMNAPGIILKDAVVTTRLRAAQVAIAVQRYCLANSRLPESLAELTPSYLGVVPADPFDPASAGLRYKQLAVGYVVYSVGEDGHDDGGDAEKDIRFAVER